MIQIESLLKWFILPLIYLQHKFFSSCRTWTCNISESNSTISNSNECSNWWNTIVWAHPSGMYLLLSMLRSSGGAGTHSSHSSAFTRLRWGGGTAGLNCLLARPYWWHFPESKSVLTMHVRVHYWKWKGEWVCAWSGAAHMCGGVCRSAFVCVEGANERVCVTL